MASQISYDNDDNRTLSAHFLGFHRPYHETLALMNSLHGQVARGELSHQLMLLEHAPVITTTRQHGLKSIKTSEAEIRAAGIDLLVADRGGDVTFHGPGQLVGYPIISLAETASAGVSNGLIDVEGYIRSLERGLLFAVHRLGIADAQLLKGFSGIWVRSADKEHSLRLRKLIAIGVHISDQVSKHGFALNISIDHARYARHIIPCGLKDRGVITLEECFSMKSLEMPDYSAIVTTVSECLSKTFSLTLAWRS